MHERSDRENSRFARALFRIERRYVALRGALRKNSRDEPRVNDWKSRALIACVPVCISFGSSIINRLRSTSYRLACSPASFASSN